MMTSNTAVLQDEQTIAFERAMLLDPARRDRGAGEGTQAGVAGVAGALVQ